MKDNKQLFTTRFLTSHNTEGAFSLIEMLVVIAVFSILAVIASQALTLSLRGTKKSESVIEVKNNVEYAMSTMERLLRNAQSITSCTASSLQYIDENDNPGSFTCDATNKLIASGSANIKLTNSSLVSIDSCGSMFDCPPVTNSPPVILINVEATHKNNAILGTVGADVTSKTRILLRTY